MPARAVYADEEHHWDVVYCMASPLRMRSATISAEPVAVALQQRSHALVISVVIAQLVELAHVVGVEVGVL